jgi:hypothetical protein
MLFPGKSYIPFWSNSMQVQRIYIRAGARWWYILRCSLPLPHLPLPSPPLGRTHLKKKWCLLVLNSVTSPPRWIRQPQLRAMHGVCVCCFFFLFFLEASHPADFSAPVFSGTSAFSLRLTPSRLTSGATSALQSPPRFHLCPSSPFGHVCFTSPLHPGFYYTHLM